MARIGIPTRSAYWTVCQSCAVPGETMECTVIPAALAAWATVTAPGANLASFCPDAKIATGEDS